MTRARSCYCRHGYLVGGRLGAPGRCTICEPCRNRRHSHCVHQGGDSCDRPGVSYGPADRAVAAAALGAVMATGAVVVGAYALVDAVRTYGPLAVEAARVRWSR